MPSAAMANKIETFVQEGLCTRSARPRAPETKGTGAWEGDEVGLAFIIEVILRMMKDRRRVLPK